MKKNVTLCFLLVAMSLALLPACGKNTEPQEIEEQIETPAEEAPVAEEPQEEPEEEEPAIDTYDLHITFVNQCNVDIGMLSVIDPVTGEQAQVDPIPAGESVSLDAKWPVDATEFHWALYNVDGDLYMECTTDITVASTDATITLIGDDEVTQIQEEYK